MKIPQVIQLSHRHIASSQLGRAGSRTGTTYAAKKITAATISGHSVVRSQRRLSADRSAASAVIPDTLPSCKAELLR
jgi:hypothetical protein